MILSIIQTSQLHLFVEGDGVGEGLVLVFGIDNGGGEFLPAGFVGGSYYGDILNGFKFTAPFNGCIDLDENIVADGGVHLFGEYGAQAFRVLGVQQRHNILG